MGTQILTGAVSEPLALTEEDCPERLEHSEWAALTAAWFWSRNGLNRLADTGQPECIALWRSGQEVPA